MISKGGGGEQAHLRRFIDIIAKKWAILIISIIGHFEKIRFKDSMQKFDGISPKTLTDVVKDLKKENLIHRESFSEIPPWVEYPLTKEGKQLCKAVLPLIPWQRNAIPAISTGAGS